MINEHDIKDMWPTFNIDKTEYILQNRSRNTLSELNGGKLSGNHYYLAKVDNPINTEASPYIAECGDIIEALNMTFNEGEAFKAIWRLASSRQGRGKPGNKAVYDADKAAHYSTRIAAQTRVVEAKQNGQS